MAILNVKELGLKGDGATLETEAIQKIIDGAGKGDTIVFPKGYYVTGTLALKGDLTIELQRGAELVGSRNIEHYRDCGFYHNEMKKTISLIYALDCDNIRITGEGKIQMNGDAFFDFDAYCPPFVDADTVTKEYAEQMVIGLVARPTQPIFFNNCKNLTIDGIKIFNSPCWTIVFSNCENILVENIYVDNHNRIGNNDGVHCTASRNIVVRNSTFLCGDDCFAGTCITNTEGVCENIEIYDCLMSSRSAAIRFGHLYSKVRNINVHDITIIRSNRAIAIFTGDDGIVENAHFENITADTKIYGGWWWGKGEPIVVCAKNTTGELRDISFKNCHFVHENPAIIVGEGDNVSGVTLDGCTFKAERGSTHPYFVGKMDLQPNIPDLIPNAPFEFGDSIYVDGAEVTVDGETV